MGKVDKQDARVMTILGTKNLDVTEAKLAIYLQYLKEHLEFPVQLTGIEDFDWEEYYVLGPGSKKEYEQLKKTRPSYTDTFKLLGFEEMIDEWTGILVKVERVSDRKRFTLPLADLEVTDKKAKNYELIDDYAVWFVNNR